MATAQKRGFRFPWGGDGGRDESDPAAPDDSGPYDDPTLAQRLGAVPDDLGRGPFDLGGGSGDDEPREVAEAEPLTRGPAANGAPVAAGSTQTAPSAPRGPVTPPAAPRETTQTPVASEPAVADPAPDPRTAWPDADWRSERPAPPSRPVAQPQTASTARHDNPLVMGLVRAMRDAARAARDESVTALHAAATERAQAMRAHSTASAASLRRSADTDVAAVREWSKAEMARVREETEARIADRRARLVTEAEDEARATEARLAALADTIQQYEAEAAAFFEALLAEEDPARLAGLAERLPPPPSLEEFAVAETEDATDRPRLPGPRSPRSPSRASASRATRTHTTARPASVRPATAGRASADRVAGSHAATATSDATTAPVREPQPAPAPGVNDPAKAAPTGDVELAMPGQLANDLAADELEALDADAAEAAEAEALAGLDRQMQLIVSGLTSVGSIASFKAALVRSAGVNAVSVMAGADGDCMFTVTHAADADLRAAIRDLEPFQARVIADDGSTLVVVAHDRTT